MTYNRFFFNRGLWWYAFRKIGWLGGLFLLALIISLPLGLINQDSLNSMYNINSVNHLYQIMSNFQIMIILVFPAIIAVWLSHYMHSRRAVDLFHSLPFKRYHLLTSSLGIGILMLLIPVWITALITMLVHTKLSYLTFSGMQILQWGASTSAIVLIVFAFTILVGVWVGQSILQLVIATGLLLLPTILTTLLNEHMKKFLYGYIGINNYYESPMFWSPAYRVAALGYRALSATEGWVYLGVSVICIVLSYWFYQKRPSEAASQSVVFPYFNPIFRFFVVLIMSLLVGLFLTALTVDQKWILFSGYIVGAIIGAFIAEMIIRKTWNVLDLRMLRSLGGYGLLTAIVLFLTASSINGFEAKVPAADEIQGVYMGRDLQYEIYDHVKASNGQEISSTINKSYFSADPNYVKAVLNLHTKIEQMRPNEGVIETDIYGLGGDQQFIQMAYLLKDGSLITRRYTLPFRDYDAYILPVINQVPYKQYYYSLDKLANYQGTIKVNNPDLYGIDSRSGSVISDPDEINELKQLIIKSKQAVQDPWHSAPVGNSLDFTIETVDSSGSTLSTESYSWDSSDKEWSTWIKEHGLLTLLTKPKDVKSINLLPSTDEALYRGAWDAFEQDNDQIITITDPKEISELLDHSQANYMSKPDSYMLKLNFKTGNSSYRQLSNTDVTPEIYKLLSR